MYSVGDNHIYTQHTVKATYIINFDYGDVDLWIFEFVITDEDGEIKIDKVYTEEDKTVKDQ